MLSKLLVVACLAAVVSADVYMQYPKGSNNRLNEANRGRNNANRLFDSQNNNRGGYNAGNLYFYAGTTMHVEWTNQHSCGGPNNHCEMILQYMCDARIRDGSTTNTIPETGGADGNPTFGRHESYQYYTEQCKWRERNRGLFTANRNLQTNNGRNGAIYTRQNENGNRYGFECPEERDYYPYWHPTQWRDIAVFTNQPEKCPSYIARSQNVAERYYCKAPQDWIQYQASMGRNGFIPINGTECIQIRALYEVDDFNNTKKAEWTFVPSFGIAPPYCTGNRFTRDNHLGNVEDGFPNGYNWTIPADVISERCVLRLRYNISTGEYAAFADVGAIDYDGVTPISAVSAPANLTYLNNSRTGNNAPTANRDPAYIDVWSKYGLQWTDVNISFNRQTNDPNGAAIKYSRDYVFKDNPKVDIFGNNLIPKSQTGDATQPAMIRLQLAINTDQFGRTFEDRSHRFAIRSMPSDLQGVRVHNLQVKGKRGNIVQNFPATEYDFWPKRLKVQNGEYIHFQWTGSNNNGDNNAGRGKAGTDRHNVLLLRAPVYPYLQRTQERNDARNAVPTIGALGSTYPTRIDGSNATFLGFGRNDLKSLALWSTYQYGGDLDQGDDAGTYFDLGPRQVNLNGIFNYACSRNNDFSNRDQKAQIIVSNEAAVFQSLGAGGGVLTADSGASLEVPPGAFTTQIVVTLLTAPSSTSSSFSGTVNSDYVTIIPIVLPLAPGATVRVNVPYQNKPLVIPQLYRSDSMNGDWSTVDGASYSGGVASADVTQGGTYVVQTQVNWGAVVGIIVGAVGFVGIVVGVMYWRFKKQQAGGTDSKMDAKV